MEKSEQINKEVSELKQKYNSLIQKLDAIEKENIHREHSIKQTENNFEVISNNIKDLMEKIDLMVEDKEANKTFNNVRKSSFSFMNMIKTPMRRITVTTMRTLFTMADYASEKSALAREGLEDIVAEAQTESKKKRPTMMPSKQC
jgi:predicted nuclease with TOPRIM domain